MIYTKHIDKLYLAGDSAYELRAYSSLQPGPCLLSIKDYTDFDLIINEYKRCFLYGDTKVKYIVVYITNPNAITDKTPYKIRKQYDPNIYAYFDARKFSKLSPHREIIISPDCSEIYGEYFEFKEREFLYDYSIIFDGIRLDTNKIYISSMYDNWSYAYENGNQCPCSIKDDISMSNIIIGGNYYPIYVAYRFSIEMSRYKNNYLMYTSSLITPNRFIPAKLFEEYNPQE